MIKVISLKAMFLHEFKCIYIYTIVVLFSTPIKDDIGNSPFITKLFLYFDFDSLSKNLSKKYICRTYSDFKFFFSARFLILPFILSILITIIPPYIF